MTIDSLDKVLIVAWHQGWHPAALDEVMPWWREKSTWIPLYILLLVWLVYSQRVRGFLLALAAGTFVGLADLTSARLIKPFVARLRPCKTPGVMEKLDILTGCGAGESFPSNHATNHFALAVFLAVTCFAERPWLKWLGLVWAASIALGQVYVGRHYFSDILAGAGLGTLYGLVGAYIFLQLSPKPHTSPPSGPSNVEL